MIIYRDHYELSIYGAKLLEVMVNNVGFGLSKHCSTIFGIFLTIQSTIHQRDGLVSAR